MKIFRSLKTWKVFRDSSFFQEKSLGFVPTMGALHLGHQALIHQCKKENSLTVVSIFINPAQFNNTEDFKKYPRKLKKDLIFLKRQKIDFVLIPNTQSLYPDGYSFQIHEKKWSHLLCGAHRPGHFEGVLTVVLKLFQIVQPKHAYFGEKDFQQLELIKGMVHAFFLPIKIISCPTVRAKNGLALSSRNTRLTPTQRSHAAQFPKTLKSIQSLKQIQKTLQKAGFRVDYIEEWKNRRLGAVYLGNVRLIDNVPL